MRPLIVTRFSVDESHWLRVFIWPDRDSLEAATGMEETTAYWHSPNIYTQKGKVFNRLVSTIHFHIGGIGAGTFAHELQHFIQFWISLGQINDFIEEDVPKLAGDLTNRFWVWFYENFQEREGS